MGIKDAVKSKWDRLGGRRNGVTIGTLISLLPKDKRREAVELIARVEAIEDFAGEIEYPISRGRRLGRS